MPSQKRKNNDQSSTKREPNDREKAAIASAREARKFRPVRAEYVEEHSGKNGALKLESPHSDADGHPYLVEQTFGTSSNAFTSSSMLQLANATLRGGKPSVEGLNASLAIIGAVEPANELEASLAVQMAATHELVMEMLRRTKTADTRDAMRDYGNLATKLSRTFTTQMKTLSDWRRGGEQVVRHVHVYEGGQAVVAETVHLGGRRNEIGAFNPHGQGALCAPMHGENAAGYPLPMSGAEGADPVPAPRRKDEGSGGT